MSKEALLLSATNMLAQMNVKGTSTYAKRGKMGMVAVTNDPAIILALQDLVEQATGGELTDDLKRYLSAAHARAQRR